jgi:hypothetical protein
MSSHRESFFDCRFSREQNEYQFHVRAWNAKEAEEHLYGSLRGNGVQEPGTLSIRDRKGVEVLRSSYTFAAGDELTS